jgi:hypothetical protein
MALIMVWCGLVMHCPKMEVAFAAFAAFPFHFNDNFPSPNFIYSSQQTPTNIITMT